MKLANSIRNVLKVEDCLLGSGCGSVGRFQLQRSVVRIQSSAKFYIESLLSTVLKRRK